MVYEDDAIVAVSKPANMSVHGGAGEEGPTLIDLLKAASEGDLHLAHRLDKATSGLVLLAKSSEMTSELAARWDRAEKRYLAIALGTIKEDTTIDAPLEDKYGPAKDAITHVRVLSHCDAIEPKTTLIEATLQTGRMHQIRLHLAQKGHPLLLDDKHGDFRANKAWIRAVRDAGGPRPKSLMLHAMTLAIEHPEQNRRVLLRAEPPESWGAILRAAGSKVDALANLP